jgi:hypothetical protein
MGNVDNYGNCWNCLGKPLLVSDHWFAHQIHHGSGGKVNVRISERYVIRSLRKITDGEELCEHTCSGALVGTSQGT